MAHKILEQKMFYINILNACTVKISNLAADLGLVLVDFRVLIFLILDLDWT